MAITVSLGTNNSDDRELTKDITWAAFGDPASTEIKCDVYEPTDRINPVIILDQSKVDLTSVNYMYIPEFGRYYFITNIVGVAGGKKEVYGHVDVLYTYDTYIRNCRVIAERSTNQQNAYLHDDMRLFNTYVRNQYLNIGKEIGPPDYLYIITLGNGEEEE